MNHQNSVTCVSGVNQARQKKGDSMERLLGQQLVREGLITTGQLEEALRNQIIYGYRLGSSLVEMGYLKEDDLVRVLSRKAGVPFVGGKELSSVPDEVIRIFSRTLAIRYHVLPFRLERNSLGLAMADPNDFKAIQEVAFATGHVVHPYVSTDVNISRAHERYYPLVNDGQLNALIPANPEESLPQTVEAVEAPDQIEQPRIVTTDQLACDLIAASSRDAVADLVTGYIAREFMTGALFIVRKRVAVGWRGVRDGAAIASCADLSLDLSEPSVLRDAVETKSCFHGTLINSPQNRQILSLLSMASGALLFVAPIAVRNQAVALMLVAADGDDSDPRLAGLLKLVKQAGLAFEMLIIKNKILMA